jgi:predicted lipid-binding transport protein (Tim44 family)
MRCVGYACIFARFFLGGITTLNHLWINTYIGFVDMHIMHFMHGHALRVAAIEVASTSGSNRLGQSIKMRTDVQLLVREGELL